MTRPSSQGYKVNRLSNTFKKFYGRHTDLIGQYKINVSRAQHRLSPAGNLINMHKIGKIASLSFSSPILANT